MTLWWLFIPVLAYTTPLPTEAACEQLRQTLATEHDLRAECRMTRPEAEMIQLEAIDEAIQEHVKRGHSS